MTEINSEYTRRIDRVIDHLRNNLDRQVKLDELAAVACFSEYHFHRLFSLIAGETVNKLTNRFRLEKAARLLRYTERSVTDISFECGFSSSATFSRAFRAGYDTSPNAFRQRGEIKNSKICKELFVASDYIIPMSKEEKKAEFPVRFVDLPERKLAYIRVVNTSVPNKVIKAFDSLVTWARSQEVFSEGTLFGMSIDDPHVTPQRLYRYEVCLAVSGAFNCTGGVSKMTMPAMRYAVVHVSGDIRKVATAWDYLFRDWLIQSSYEPEHAPALEIFLNKEKATDWSHFNLDLCLPIKNLEET